MERERDRGRWRGRGRGRERCRLGATSGVQLGGTRLCSGADYERLRGGGEVEWKCTKTIRGTLLVNGSRFKSDKLAPAFGGVDLTPHIGAGITFSPTSTIHSYQGITFEGDKLLWDVRMLYVAVSRVRCLEELAIVKTANEPRYMGEGVDHRTEKARQFGLARAAVHGAIEEYPLGDGRYIADLAVFDTVGGTVGGVGGKLMRIVEVVVTSSPSREKLEYYEELGIECVVIHIPRASKKEKEKEKKNVLQ
ncbi:hypothetical protein T492DRAFT_212468 [Pavlovales sp. CCMP2436]|nr:hypothetical protein T492DRAFT_212468 [Pavlovales sp. CCMP2436]